MGIGELLMISVKVSMDAFARLSVERWRRGICFLPGCGLAAPRHCCRGLDSFWGAGSAE